MGMIVGIPPHAVREPNFESLRLAMTARGDRYSPALFHGLVGTAFRIGGICPCAPTCTSAMPLAEAARLFGYEVAEYPYRDGGGDLKEMVAAVRAAVDRGEPALVWHAASECEWDLVAGYEEAEAAFYVRVPWEGEERYGFLKRPWSRSAEQAGLTGQYAAILGKKIGELDRRAAIRGALAEAVRHMADAENADKAGGSEWVFLQGSAAYARWAADFANPAHERGLGDAYCSEIYGDCHALAGPFLRGIAPEFPEASETLLAAAVYFDFEAKALRSATPLLGWASPTSDAARNAKASELLAEASKRYDQAAASLRTALERM